MLLLVSRRKYQELQTQAHFLNHNYERLVERNARLIDDLAAAKDELDELRSGINTKLDALSSLSANMATAVERIREQCCLSDVNEQCTLSDAE